MRAWRVLGLVLVAAVTGVLSGGSAGAAPTATALLAAAAGALPGAHRPAALIAAPVAPVEAPPGAAPVVTPPVAAPVAAPPAPAPVRAPAPAAVEAPVRVEAPAVATRRARLVPGTPCRTAARACIELSSNRAWLIRDGVVQSGPVPITHGRRGFRTPPGTFHVTFKNRDHVSSIYDAPMPYSVFFNGGIAFHQGSLREKSHGCIHLSRTAAKAFFNSLSRGDMVQVVR